MRKFTALALLFALGAAAQAKLAPVGPPPVAISPDDVAISMGAAGATFEPEYFRAPQPGDATGRVFLCRPQPFIFDKTRLTQSCH